MGKKEVVFLVLLIILLLSSAATIYSQEEDTIDPNIYALSKLNENKSELPEPVRRALMEYAESKELEEEQLTTEEEKSQKFENLIMLLITSASVLVLFMFLKQKGVFHKIIRRIRRQVLFHSIIKLSRKGLPDKEILKVLTIKGWDKKYVDDAISRHKRYLAKQGENIPSKIELLKGSRSYHDIQRRIRRQILYTHIRKLFHKGKSPNEIIHELAKRGWKQEHIEDALFKYSEYMRRERLFSKFISFISANKLVRVIRRASRRQRLYFNIKKLKAKGLDYSEILKLLVRKGWDEKYVKDAYARYNDYTEKKEPHHLLAQAFADISFIKSIRRQIRRQALFAKIKKLKKQNLPNKEIISALVKKGYEEKHAHDALYLYDVYRQLNR